MKTRNPIVVQRKNGPPRFLHVNFNQDQECFSCATEKGFEIYNTDPIQCSVKRRFSHNGMSGIGYTRMLYRTNYIGLVGGGASPRFSTNKIAIWDDIQQRDSVSIRFNSPVHELFLSRQYIVVVLAQSIDVYTFSGSPSRVCPVISNIHNGIADFVTCSKMRRASGPQDVEHALSQKHVIAGILAYPSGIRPGQIHIADLSNIQTPSVADASATHLPTSIIKAHKNPIHLVKLSPQGTMVATCSVEGTLIRVFSIASGSLIHEFRRGLDRALIYDMQWNGKGDKLAVVSDKFTLHIFQINEDLDKRHLLKGWFPKVKYLQGVWSMCSTKLDRSLLTHDEDTCKVGWIGDEALSLLWQKSGMWEKYVIMEKLREYKVDETLHSGAPDGRRQLYDLVRESWRQL
ncbi:ADL134Wp [Eremothecium gossypii ATCC 10895]|uniref:SVP1-like protein 2 n=1 Tax=Eremothecium gossypii (strain ATCC 10895 / CBS 109.51 / FGSC 9923 / NRRL Y-1056) TaxID=284811 RepID=HSV2_EREGS|nr:ADL134Wp [Eremothecium gossypii ATCC 10895]Q75AQ4.1 RecName: Full=SVP1-like protein 2 [Eremothecium gossypii ATCC 10895]AAS51786.1 ADL134Wp [Eremothecium gossypii ATCC 10895]AEY96084.1 FADL134Wp [Eremothecium gossypii FDAG1]